jgi:hypothetical protein
LEDLMFRLLERMLAEKLGLPPIADCPKTPAPNGPAAPPAGGEGAAGQPDAAELDAASAQAAATAANTATNSAADHSARAQNLQAMAANAQQMANLARNEAYYQQQLATVRSHMQTYQGRYSASASAAGVGVAPRVARSPSEIEADIRATLEEIRARHPDWINPPVTPPPKDDETQPAEKKSAVDNANKSG